MTTTATAMPTTKMLKTLTTCLYFGLAARDAAGFVGPSRPRRSPLRRAPPFRLPEGEAHIHVDRAVAAPLPPLRSEPPRTPAEFDRPDPSILISARPGTEQQDSVFAISGAVFAGTFLVVSLLSGFEDLLPNGWFAAWRDYTWPLGLGLIFTAAGVSHFTVARAFCNIVPPYGCWGGLWRVPAPGAEALGLSYEEYHCYWTGVAEVLGGLWLIASGLGIVDVSPKVPSALLGLLVRHALGIVRD